MLSKKALPGTQREEVEGNFLVCPYDEEIYCAINRLLFGKSRPRNKGEEGLLSNISWPFCAVFWRFGPAGLCFGPKIRGNKQKI